MGRVEGKVAFITGAARGQGRSHALRLAEEGADIVAVDICEAVPGTPYPGATEDDLAETVRQVEALDRRIVAEKADVRSLSDLKSVVDKGVAELGRLDVIVGNAGIDIPAIWRDITPEIFQDTIDINLTGVWNTIMSAVGHLVSGGGGSIILTSSAAGIKPVPFHVPYNAAKFGVTALAKSFAMELAKDKVRVNSVHPGGVDTDMATGAMELFDGFSKENPDLMGMFTQWFPGSMPPREISNAVLYLASDESTWVTGHTLAVDGGMTSY
ncbi:mycofactocin-coupled SDR family oxidoreductase [Nesterenkonia alkaliphila]|uniref:Mycofactocin-coupled SDR family oxidoreductase n=1 Tax=Nesterenkonia alkaliphila TaxID=1463631 RepID=A0A7K1UFI9_9MICC|nr:mycofactocin-coupled SDR family oxidoreductase [Nesterenkonia alkaliphila]MVT25192.1 mycofactocin-coupled SDR family oxidoreductase [Nesterenkonia alkaliphila]GFZ93676.1 3-ketoacyl-ACP reductase [Nesterenkonia alkaliphila]